MGVVTTLPRGRPLSRADLEGMPDDGHRYELVDGSLIVTPAPSLRHQIVVGELFVLLRQHCPVGLAVILAPFDVVLDDDTVLQPDLIVARRRDLTAGALPTAPVLAVEVLSPSTRQLDLSLKRARFEAAGCPSYWAVDPDAPSLTVWEDRGEGYVDVAHAAGTDRCSVDRPYPVVVRPVDLLGR
ncbi:MAG: Uma2 family endonuclease [Nocardioidaceae bacterium]